MKIELEDADVDDIKAVARDCFNVALTNEEVVKLFYENKVYAGLVYAWGVDDTENRTALGKVLKKMGKIP